MNIQPVKTRIFQENENLFNFICKHIKTLPTKSVLIITSKIISLAEGRTEKILSRDPEEIKQQKEKLIRQESDLAIHSSRAWITIKNTDVSLSAGIDRSNANGKFILLPQNCFKSAEDIRYQLLKHYNITDLGVVITDSRSTFFKKGSIGVALGYAGFKGIKEYKGTTDLFGRELRVSRANMADSLAAGANLTMGESNQSQPLAIITAAPITFSDTTDVTELQLTLHDNIYKPLFDYIRDEELKNNN